MNYVKKYQKSIRYPFQNIENKLITVNVALEIADANNIVQVFCILVSQMHLIKEFGI